MPGGLLSAQYRSHGEMVLVCQPAAAGGYALGTACIDAMAIVCLAYVDALGEEIVGATLPLHMVPQLAVQAEPYLERRPSMIVGVTHDQDGRAVQQLSISTKVSIGLPPNGDCNHPTKLDHFVFLRKKKSANRLGWPALQPT